MGQNFGFVKVAAAVPGVEVADCPHNVKEIEKQIAEAEGLGVQIIVFPELSVTAYTCADLFGHTLLLEQAQRALSGLLEATAHTSPLCVVGMPVAWGNSLYNCAVAFQQGRILGVVPKSYLPNYKEFYEERWFASGLTVTGETVELCGSRVPFGVDLLFESAGAVVGIELCEDLWVPIPPSSHLARQGADIILNLSATNELIGKHRYLLSLLQQQSARCLAGYVYASAGFGESSTDLVFAGNGIVLENGSMEATMDTLYSTVTGTEQNAAFELYKAEAHRLDSLRGRLHERYLELVADSQMTASLESSMYRQYGRLDDEATDRAYRFIRQNRNSPASLWLLESMQSRFSEAQLEQLLSELGSRNKSAQVLTDIAQRLRSADKIEPGSPYADVTLVDMWGRSTSLSGYVGYARYVVIGFWVSDSDPACRAMVRLGQLYREYGYRGATFLSVALDTDAAQWREQVRSLNLPAHQCIAAEPEEVESRYALASVPAFVVINPDGSVNSRNLTVEQLESKLKELLPYRVRRDSVNRVEIDSMKK